MLLKAFDVEASYKFLSLNIKSIRIVELVYTDGAISIDDISSKLKLDYKDVLKIASEDGVKYFVDRFNGQTGNTILIVSRRLSSNFVKCRDCAFAAKVKGGWRCKNKMNSLLLCNLWRVSFMAYKKLLSSGYKLDEYGGSGDTISRNRGKEVNEGYKLKPLKDWDVDDFSRFFHEKYKPYDHLLTFSLGALVKRTVKMKKIFEVEFDELWKYYLKKYIDWYFTDLEKTGKNPTLFAMTNIDNLKKFREMVPDVSFCSKHMLFCPYKGKCKKVGCNDHLLNKIRERYN